MSFGRALKRRVRDAMLPAAFAELAAISPGTPSGDFGLVARDRSWRTSPRPAPPGKGRDGPRRAGTARHRPGAATGSTATSWMSGPGPCPQPGRQGRDRHPLRARQAVVPVGRLKDRRRRRAARPPSASRRRPSAGPAGPAPPRRPAPRPAPGRAAEAARPGAERAAAAIGPDRDPAGSAVADPPPVEAAGIGDDQRIGRDRQLARAGSRAGRALPPRSAASLRRSPVRHASPR